MFLQSSQMKSIIIFLIVIFTSFSYSSAQSVNIDSRLKEMKTNSYELATWLNKRVRSQPPDASWSHSGRITKILRRGDALRGERDVTKWYEFGMTGSWTNVNYGKWFSTGFYGSLGLRLNLTTEVRHNAPECNEPTTVTSIDQWTLKLSLDFGSGSVNMSVDDKSPFVQSRALFCFPSRSDGYVAYKNSVSDKSSSAQETLVNYFTKRITLPNNQRTFISKLNRDELDVFIIATNKHLTESTTAAYNYIQDFYGKEKVRQKEIDKENMIAEIVKSDIDEINKAIDNNESDKAIKLLKSLINNSEKNEDIRSYLSRKGYNLQNEIAKIKKRKADYQKSVKDYINKAEILFKKGEFYEARTNYNSARNFNKAGVNNRWDKDKIDQGLSEIEAILKYNSFLEEYPLHVVYKKRPADKSTKSSYTRANPGSTRDVRQMINNIAERAQDNEKVSYMASLGKANGFLITYDKSDTEFPLLSNADSGGTSTDDLLSLNWLDSTFPSKPIVMIYNNFLKKWFILSEIIYNTDEPESAQFEKVKKEFKIVITDNWYKLKNEYKKWQRQGFGTIKSIDYVEGRFVALLNKGDDYYLFERFLRPDTVDREFNRTKKYMTFFHTLTNDNEAVYLHQTLDDNYLAKKYRSFDEFYIDFKEMGKTHSVYALQFGK